MHFQINWYAKKMNVSCPKHSWISWTVVSLNWLLPLHKFFKLMVNKKATTQPWFVKGTVEDSDIIYNALVEKLGITWSVLTKRVKFDWTLFYEDKADFILRLWCSTVWSRHLMMFTRVTWNTKTFGVMRIKRRQLQIQTPT